MNTDHIVDAVPILEGGDRWVLEYRTKNELGDVIGDRSYFWGDSPESCYKQAIRAHQLATRAIERLKYKNSMLEKKVLALSPIETPTKA